jgi:hypothetical protein
MKTKKILLLCLLPLMAEVIAACCNCKEPPPQKYRFNQMSVYNLDNSGKDAIETSAAETSQASYGIRIKFTTLMAAVPAVNNSYFLSSSQASDCCPPPYYPVDRIEGLKVISMYDFDQNHKSGSDVTKYFAAFYLNKYYADSSILESDLFGYNLDEQKNVSLDLMLMARPGASKQQFRVEIKFENGRELKQTTPLINLI